MGDGVRRTSAPEAIFAEKVIFLDDPCSHCFVLCIKGGMYKSFEVCLGVGRQCSACEIGRENNQLNAQWESSPI